MSYRPLNSPGVRIILIDETIRIVHSDVPSETVPFRLPIRGELSSEPTPSLDAEWEVDSQLYAEWEVDSQLYAEWEVDSQLYAEWEVDPPPV